jgi:two-component system response regulator HydG
MNPILVVDDDLQGLESTRRILEHAGYVVETASDGHAALERVRSGPPLSAVVSDVRMPRMGGMEFLRALSLCGQKVPVVLMTAFGTVEDAVWALKFGAVDFLTKPFRRQVLLEAVQAAVKRVGPKGPATGPNLVGNSASLVRMLEEVSKVAQTQATVLITGESGSGKERVARMLHQRSPRAEAPWVAINCAAVPESLLESELFGYEKGAFSGAVASKPGLFESAEGGTLFLDEIGDMPLALQAKLLRVLQEGEVRRLGALQERKINVRIVAATHQNLEESVRAGKFRQDLLFRLEVVNIRVPALRDRVEDVAALARHFAQTFSARHGKQATALSDESLAALEAYSWPGNIRELANAVERAVIFSNGPCLELRDFPAHIAGQAAQAQPAGVIEVRVGTPLKEVEDLLIRRTLAATEGDKVLAARLLGVNERTIYRRLKDE